MARKELKFNPDNLIQDYLDGMLNTELVKKYGIPYGQVRRLLYRAGVVRSTTEANRLLASRRTPEENRALTAAARKARKGQVDSEETLIRRALGRERTQSGATIANRYFAELLGVADVVLEKAIGPYNVDIAISPIAVELFGGGFHAWGRHAARSKKRTEYILNAGWSLVFVWYDRAHPVTLDAAQRVLTFREELQRDPSSGSKYWVIWGTGEDVPTTHTYFHNGTGIPPS